MSVVIHNIGTKLRENILEITGFSAGGTVTSIKYASFFDNVFEAAVVALISGFIGAFAAHFAKKLINKLKL